MTALRVLIIGGTGTISTDVSALALERGIDLTLLNRGASAVPAALASARHLVGDADDAVSIAAAIGDREFDVVATFRAFRPEQVQADIDLFTGRTGQYIFISSASAYAKPVVGLPIRESSPLRNPFWQYSRDKIAGEELSTSAFRATGFPVTIVRPSHTYNAASVPLEGGWTQLERMRRGAPVVIHGDGTSLWTLTHARDFAPAFVGLFGNPHAIGEAVHITGDETLTWNQIAGLLGRALGVEPEIVHVTSDAIATEVPDWGPGLLGDKAHSVIFDNSKIRTLVPGWVATTPFEAGAREIVEWHLADPARQRTDADLDSAIDQLVEHYG